jgi:hypothetical protein
MKSGAIALSLLTSALDGGEWLASRLSRFTPADRAAGTRWTADWVGRRAGLDNMLRRVCASQGEEEVMVDY